MLLDRVHDRGPADALPFVPLDPALSVAVHLVNGRCVACAFKAEGNQNDTILVYASHR